MLVSWRENQLETAKSDLLAIEALYSMAYDDGAGGDAASSTPSESVSNLRGVIETLSKGGDLSCTFASDASAAKSGSDPLGKDIHYIWSVEPNGFNRLKLTCPLRVIRSQGNELSLSRRFSTQEMTDMGAEDWASAIAFGSVPILLGLGWAYARRRRTKFLASLASWAKLAPDPAIIAMDNSLNREITIQDPQAGEILQRASTEFHQRLDSVQRSAEQSSRVMSAMPVGVLAFDENLKLLFVNRAGMELLNLGTAIQFGQPMIEVIRQPNVVNLIQQVSSSPQVQEVELELPLSKCILRLRAHPLSNAEATSTAAATGGVLLTLTDETRLKQLENARRDFTANVSHELKTPLSAIKAYAETLLMGALEDEDACHRFVECIAEQANRLDSLIRDLLHLTRIQSQPDKPQLSDLLLDDVLKTCVEEHRTIGLAKRIEIDTTGVEQDCRVEADLESLRTVIGNLLSNAVRYNREGGWIRVATRRTPESVILLISDSGIGIPPEDLDRIFERFYRVEKARSQDAGGTGLGLAIVKHLVQAMSAEIHVSSALGKGSSFELKLKTAASNQERSLQV